MKSIKEDKSIPVYGDGKNIREWMHVEDACRAIFKILLSKNKSFRFNIGSDLRYKNTYIAKKIFQIILYQKIK